MASYGHSLSLFLSFNLAIALFYGHLGSITGLNPTTLIFLNFVLKSSPETDIPEGHNFQLSRASSQGRSGGGGCKSDCLSTIPGAAGLCGEDLIRSHLADPECTGAFDHRDARLKLYCKSSETLNFLVSDKYRQ